MDLTVQQIVFAVAVGLFTLATAVGDYRSRRIPNYMTVPFFAAGLIYQVVFNSWSGLGDAGLAFAAGFGTLFILWMLGGGGGGDVKLMGALSVWLGLRLTLWVMIASTVLVLALTILLVAWSVIVRGPYRTRRKYMAERETTKSGKKKPKRETLEQRQKRRVMAYAIPVALATWIVVLWKLPTI